MPCGAKSEKLSAVKAVSATTTKNTSTPIFTHTMTAFTRADSLVPRARSREQSSTTTSAGTFTRPPAPGG